MNPRSSFTFIHSFFGKPRSRSVDWKSRKVLSALTFQIITDVSIWMPPGRKDLVRRLCRRPPAVADESRINDVFRHNSGEKWKERWCWKVSGTDGKEGKNENDGIGEMRRMVEREQACSPSGWLSSGCVTGLIYGIQPSPLNLHFSPLEKKHYIFSLHFPPLRRSSSPLSSSSSSTNPSS